MTFIRQLLQFTELARETGALGSKQDENLAQLATWIRTHAAEDKQASLRVCEINRMINLPPLTLHDMYIIYYHACTKDRWKVKYSF